MESAFDTTQEKSAPEQRRRWRAVGWLVLSISAVVTARFTKPLISIGLYALGLVAGFKSSQTIMNQTIIEPLAMRRDDTGQDGQKFGSSRNWRSFVTTQRDGQGTVNIDSR